MWKTAFAVLLVLAAPALASGAPSVSDGFDAVADEESNAVPEAPELDSGREGACSKTARAALRACLHEIEDDYWIATGKCLNLDDEDDRRECLQEARAERSEARRHCREQYAARKDVCDLLGEEPYDPEIEPEDFMSPAEAAANPNPYFPLAPGLRWVYEGGGETIEVTVLEDTKEVAGITAFVVRDVVREDGEIIEDTLDWYALDEEGNVWYLGEHSQSFENGELVSLDGSWKTDVEGAKPGIIMEAAPEVGDAYRQEFLLGDAEDIGEVLSTMATASAPGGACDGDCVVTKDTTPIEPDVLEHKVYAPGIGLILEVDPETGERIELIEHAANGIARAAAPPRSEGAPARALPSSFPNPFRSQVTVRFSLPAASTVSAEVFDVNGRMIRAMDLGSMGAGEHSLRWDGTDGDRRPAAVGIYFVRVRAGGESWTREVVLAR